MVILMSRLTETLLWQIEDVGLPAPVRELRFKPPRRWRFDLAWPQHMVAMEVEGGVWTRGRHTRGMGFIQDMEKYNAAGIAGWLVLRAHGGSIRTGDAIESIVEALGARSWSRIGNDLALTTPANTGAPVPCETQEDLAFLHAGR